MHRSFLHWMRFPPRCSHCKAIHNAITCQHKGIRNFSPIYTTVTSRSRPAGYTNYHDPPLHTIRNGLMGNGFFWSDLANFRMYLFLCIYCGSIHGSVTKCMNSYKIEKLKNADHDMEPLRKADTCMSVMGFATVHIVQWEASNRGYIPETKCIVFGAHIVSMLL